jgi:tetratricopeptide (TPR) repeat protein
MNDSSTSARPVARSRRRWILIAAIGISVAITAYCLFRPTPPPIPAVATDGLDPDVIAAFQKARNNVEANPESDAAWGEYGMVLFAQSRHECVDMFVEAERLNPKESRWPYLRGMALVQQQPDEGIAALRRAVDLNPFSFTIRLRLAEELLKVDRIDEAERVLGRLMDEEPGNPRVLLGMGLVLMRRDRLAEAVPLIQKASEHPTASQSGPAALAAIYARQGNAVASETENRRAANAAADARWPDPILTEVDNRRVGLETLLGRGVLLLRDGKAEQAEKVFAEIVRQRPDSDVSHLMLAQALIGQNRMADAEAHLRQAISINPQLVDAHFFLGGALMVRKDYAGAEKSYLRAIELRPAYGLAYFNLGECYLKRENRAAAMSAFRDAISCRPDLAPPHAELAALLLQDGKTDEAIEHLEGALQIDPNLQRARKLLDEARMKSPR